VSRRRKLLTTLGLLVAALPAVAAVRSIGVTLDVRDIHAPFGGFTGGAEGTPPFQPGFGVDIAEGDTFDFTIDFSGAQTITLVNPTLLWALSFTDTGSNVVATGSLTLLDAQGLPLYTSAVKTDEEGAAHLGQVFNLPGDFPSALPASLTIGGLHYVGTVVDYVVPGITTRHYGSPGFDFFADSFSVTVPVPEPAPAALLLAGLAALALRRRAPR
jgi:hypothetical protein